LEVAPRQVGKKRAMGPQENAMKKKNTLKKWHFGGSFLWGDKA
jgi:hypothetical protein